MFVSHKIWWVTKVCLWYKFKSSFFTSFRKTTFYINHLSEKCGEFCKYPSSDQKPSTDHHNNNTVNVFSFASKDLSLLLLLLPLLSIFAAKAVWSFLEHIMLAFNRVLFGIWLRELHKIFNWLIYFWEVFLRGPQVSVDRSISGWMACPPPVCISWAVFFYDFSTEPLTRRPETDYHRTFLWFL